MPNSQRKNLSDIYRPVGPKPIQLGIPWVSGGQFQLSQTIDLSLPIRGVRVKLSGRCVVGGAGMASTTPEGFLNLISNLTIQGTNARQKGNLTLWNLDLPTIYGFEHLMNGDRAAFYAINSGSGLTQVTPPGTPWPTDNNPTGSTGTFDFMVVIDLPFYPMGVNYFGVHPQWVPAYLVRNEEWKDSLQISGTFPTVVNGAVAGALGTGAGATTLVFSSFGSGAGTPTVDLYSLPIVMGLNLKDGVVPGVLSRTATPINVVLQNAGSAPGVTLLNMQKQPTTRVLIKNGTGTAPPAFATLSDTNITSAGILLGANRNVRNVVDVFAHKALEFDTYERRLVQGYMMFDFMESANPDSAYPGQDIGDGSTFQLTGIVAGLANAQGIIVQEQTLHTPTGPLYTY